ncbi:uncharacterized protein [Palaemon carinicauda]|uniref:uncharacterized protein n=1 Tax=Palaemon carinicauda TaxID=392227 RepID=UPI0035B689CA
MATFTPKECGVCNEFFDSEKHCPKLLPCFHCLCAYCLDRLIKSNSKTCPFCREVFVGNTSKDFRTNSYIIDLLEYINKLESFEESNPSKESSICDDQMIKDLKADKKKITEESIVNCHEAVDQITTAMDSTSKLKESLIKLNHMIRQEILAVMNNIVKNNEKQIENLDNENAMLESYLRSWKKHEKMIKDMEREMDSAKNYSSIGPILDRTLDVSKVTTKFTSDLENFLSKNKATQDNIIQQRNEWISQGIDIIELFKNMTIFSHEMTPPMTEEDVPKHITIHHFLSMGDPLKEKIRKGEVFASHNDGSRERYAKIELCEEKGIIVQRLMKHPLPFNSSVVEFDDVMKLTDLSNRLAFLEIADEQKPLGRIYFRLSPDSLWARIFFRLCTAEKGFSHVNGVYEGVTERPNCDDEWTFLGYRHPFDMALLFPEETWQEEMDNEIWGMGKEGIVVASYMPQNTRFAIALRKRYNDSQLGVFGMVEQGLDILKKALSKHPRDPSKITVTDCGVVLNL